MIAARDDIAARGVRVKPLEWKYDEKRDMWTADGVFGIACTVSDSQWFRADASEWVWVDGGNEAAKAAAQADYEAHIRSALDGDALAKLIREAEARGMDRALNEAFGQRIRVAMAVARVSRQEMAKACSVSPQAVQRWADGSAYPTSGKLMIFCDLTGCSMEWLLWPHPVDMRSTEWALNGTHIKNIVRTVMDELAEEA